MRRLWIALITAVIVLAGASAPRAVSVSASNHSDAAAAKKCKKGYQRVQGKCKKKPAASFSQQADDYLKSVGFGGSVLIASKGKILVSNGYGMADRGHGVANTSQTPFLLASVSKQFTAMAIMQLQELGKLNVHDLACTYIDKCPALWKDITIHQLLTHTSGITHLDGEGGYQRATIPGWDLVTYFSSAQTVDLVKNIPLLFKPGTDFHYTNLGFVALSLIIEKASGEPYAQFLKDHIFGPLGMTGTGVMQDGVVVPNIATAYDGDSVIGPAYLNFANAVAARGLYSTVNDLYLWDQALVTEKLVSKKSLDAMFTPWFTFPNMSQYGYGWGIDSVSGHRLIFHQGSMPGVSTINGFFPDAGVTIVILSNDDKTDVNPIFDHFATVTLGAASVAPAVVARSG